MLILSASPRKCSKYTEMQKKASSPSLLLPCPALHSVAPQRSVLAWNASSVQEPVEKNKFIIVLMVEYYKDMLLSCPLSAAAFLCVFGWTFWRIPTSSSTSTCLKLWTPRCLSSLRHSWTPAPRASTNSAGYVHATGMNKVEMKFDTFMNRNEWINVIVIHLRVQDSPSNKLLYAKEISTYKKMVDE